MPQAFRRLASQVIAVISAIVVVGLCLTWNGGALQPTGAFAQEATPGITASESSVLAAASAWLRAQQAANGGFPGFSGEIDPGTTADAVLALYSAQDVDPDAAGALQAAIAYLEQNGAEYARIGAGEAAKLALAAVAGGRDPHAFAGVDLITLTQAPTTLDIADPISGIYGADLFDHAMVMLALAAAGDEAPEDALAPLRDRQGADGGWSWDGSTRAGAAESNTTALIVQALAASGHGDDAMVERGLAFLLTLRAPDDRGYASQGADELVADAESTALVLQALVAAGQDPALPVWGNVPHALANVAAPDGGLRYLASEDEPSLLATVQAMPALAGKPLPVARGCAADDVPESDGCLPLAPAA
jgi:hypothetical protein